jgi:hypothetical protein
MPIQEDVARITNNNKKERSLLFLNVPFTEKDEAKALGAQWNAEMKKWYVPDGVDNAPFARWNVAQAIQTSAALEKRGLLFVDLVPRSAWFSNLRSEITKGEWEQVKQVTFKVANHVCEICAGRGPKHPVECHERWHYDEQTRTQTLLRTIALCPDCHEATHYGLAGIKGRASEAKQHLMWVNRWEEAVATEHIRKANTDWKRRSEIKWVLDARWLLGFVSVSAATRQKILGHAAGLEARTVKGWQKEILTGKTV